MFENKIKPLIRILWRRFCFWLRPIKPIRWTHPVERRNYMREVRRYLSWRYKRQSQAMMFTLTYITAINLYNDAEPYEFVIECLYNNQIAYMYLHYSNTYPLPSVLEDVKVIFLQNLPSVWDQLDSLDEWSIFNSKLKWKRFLYFKEFHWELTIPNLTSLGVYTAVTFLYVLVGGTIPLFERKYLSLIQRRIGPKFVGYNGRLQVLADALKLLFKEMIVLKTTNIFIFFTLPIATLVINLFLCGTIVWSGSIYTFNTPYTIFIILIVELLTTILITYIGILTKNKYTLITSIRIINGTVVFEIFLISVLSYFYLIYDTTGFLGSFNHPILSFKLVYFWTIAGVLLHFVLLVLKKVPFDIIEAETELIMGYTSEHSGFLSGSLILVEYLHLLFWTYFIGSSFIL